MRNHMSQGVTKDSHNRGPILHDILYSRTVTMAELWLYLDLPTDTPYLAPGRALGCLLRVLMTAITPLVPERDYVGPP